MPQDNVFRNMGISNEEFDYMNTVIYMARSKAGLAENIDDATKVMFDVLIMGNGSSPTDKQNIKMIATGILVGHQIANCSKEE
jgi:hypothetical protein